jgi:hypothetical protein
MKKTAKTREKNEKRELPIQIVLHLDTKNICKRVTVSSNYLLDLFFAGFSGCVFFVLVQEAWIAIAATAL